MRRFLNWLSRKRFPYEPLITVNLSKHRLLHNLNEFRKLIPHGYVAPVLKSNAYGHGLFEIARMLQNDPRIPFFVVDSYFEAVALRAHGVRTPLLIIGYTRPRTIAESDLQKTAFTITNIDTLKALKDVSSAVHIHIKIDTGMRRQGILIEEIPFVLDILKNNPEIVLEGICTHLCDADNSDESFTETQIGHWNKIVAEFKAEFPKLRYIHAAATDGSRFSDDIRGNVVRLGIGLYGITENKELVKMLSLEPVLKMTTVITGLKMLMQGETIGYGNTHTASEDSCIATIPVGYFEGLDRRLSNTGVVQVGEQKMICPLIGRISMNISSVDVSTLPGVCELKMSLPVTVISNNASDENSIVSMAKKCGTIPYEIAVHIPAHLKRVIVN